MHEEGQKRKGSRAKGRGGLERMFEFYALLATGFPLRLWLVRRRDGLRWGPTSVKVFTALTIQLSHVKTFFVRLVRVSQLAF